MKKYVIQILVFWLTVTFFLIRPEFGAGGFSEDNIRYHLFFIVVPVEPFRHFIDFCFIEVPDDGKYTIPVSVKGGLACGTFRFIASRHYKTAKLVSEIHKQYPPHPALKILFCHTDSPTCAL